MRDEFDPTFEHERRFLVADSSVVRGAPWELITQAYVFSLDGFAIRVRRIQEPLQKSSRLTEGRAWLTGKGPRFGVKREEYDIEVSPLWAQQVIDRCEDRILKRRYQVVTDQAWEIDEFLDHNQGLWIAELEGGQEILSVRVPAWALREIVNEPLFNNEELAKKKQGNASRAVENPDPEED